MNNFNYFLNKNCLFGVLHINVRSLLRNFNDFKLQVLRNQYSIIFVNETWLDLGISDDVVALEGYILFRRDRADRRGGGVAVYVKDELSNATSYEVATSTFESKFISFKYGGRKFIMGTVYRPPCLLNFDGFLREFEHIVNQIMLECDTFLCSGDFNVNVGDLSNCKVQSFLNILESYNIVQYVDQPTRVTNNTTSILDLILCSEGSLVNKIKVFDDIRISDHCWVSCELDTSMPIREQSTVTYRNFRNFNLHDFTEDLLEIPFNNIYRIPNLDNKFELFNELLINIFDKHAPICTSRLNKKPYAPWMTGELRSLMKDRDKARSNYQRYRSDVNLEKYRKLRNKVTAEIKKSKRNYLSDKFTPHDTAGNWSILKKFNLTKTKGYCIPAHLKTVEGISNHFASVINNNFVPCVDLINKYELTARDNIETFNFSMTDENSILNILNDIKSNSVGFDGLSVTMIRYSCPYILPVLTHLINSCFELNAIPRCWKTSFITPVPKTKAPSEFSDLRPISILPALSKVFEKIVNQQMRAHLDANGLLPDFQSGFRPQHGCISGLLKVTDDILEAADKGLLTALVLLDYSKAFDKLNHKLLLAIMRYYGFGMEALQLISDYLTDRRQCVRLGTSVSTPIGVSSGVPQGSILGPLLFILYTSELFVNLINSNIHLYADDTQLYISFLPGMLNESMNRLQDDVNRLVSASQAFGLDINFSKCQLMLLGRPHDVKRYSDLVKLQLSDEIILNCLHSVKNLGITMDTSLRYTLHVNDCIKRSFVKLKLIYSVKDFLDRSVRRMLCDSLVLSTFNYGDLLYNACLTKHDSYRLQLMQNSCVRFICGIRKHCRGVSSALREIGWLSMQERRIHHCMVFYHNVVVNKTPGYLYDKITWNTSRHHSITRFGNMIMPPRHTTALYERSFTYNIYRMYNALTRNLVVTHMSLSVLSTKIKNLIKSGNFGQLLA